MHLLYSRTQRRSYLRMRCALEAFHTAVYALDPVPLERKREWGPIQNSQVEDVCEAEWGEEL